MKDHDYKILVGNKETNYHANMLKNYVREDEAEIGNKIRVLKLIVSAEVLLDKKTQSLDKKLLLELGMYRKKKVSDVKLVTELNNSQSKTNKQTVASFARRP